MAPLARVRIVMWEGASLWIVDAAQAREGETGRAAFHAHHAIQISLALGGWFRLDTQNAHVRSEVAAVAADTKHVIDAEGLTGIVFIEPESEAGRAITRRLFAERELVVVESQTIGDFRERLAAAGTAQDDRTLVALGRELVSILSAGAVANDADPRIRKVIAWAAEQIDQPISLSDALAVGGLSASRLRHLFVEQTGLPFKTYLLWLRLTRAVDVIAGGATLTQAAHEAGFSDSAHFSRTFRRMFGVPPAALRIV
jgi:AraC family transcriptional regulator